MKMNPVYKREMMVSSRSFWLTLVLMIFNGILAMVALLNMYSTLEQVKLTAEIQYTSFIDLYLFVAVLEFIMVIFIMPAITAGSISGEKERRTLEVMMTTKLTPAQVVFGKLQAALSTMLLLVASSLPILALVFVYGGVTFRDLLLLFISYMTAAFFAGGLGICCSAVFGKSTAATVISYVLLGILALGTYGVNWLAVYMGQVRADAIVASTGAAAAGVTSGRLVYLLLLNPTTSFIMLMMRMAGQDPGMTWSGQLFGNHGMQSMDMLWIGGSMLIQIVIASVLIRIAVKALTPGKKVRI
jgi:ABC-type transport system involved in multi-copper enzyme maturation permease subunit